MKLTNLTSKLRFNESRVSMFFGIVIIFLAGFLLVDYFRKQDQGITTSGSSATSSVAEAISEISEETNEYTVAEGDNLWKISEARYGSGYNWVDIAKENSIKNADKIMVGQKLVFPKTAEIKELPKTGMETTESITTATQSPIASDSYIVTEGDTLWDIAVRAYSDGYKWSEIAKVNKVGNPNIIFVDQELVLPR